MLRRRRVSVRKQEQQMQQVARAVVVFAILPCLQSQVCGKRSKAAQKRSHKIDAAHISLPIDTLIGNGVFITELDVKCKHQLNAVSTVSR